MPTCSSTSFSALTIITLGQFMPEGHVKQHVNFLSACLPNSPTAGNGNTSQFILNITVAMSCIRWRKCFALLHDDRHCQGNSRPAYKRMHALPPKQYVQVVSIPPHTTTDKQAGYIHQAHVTPKPC
jgi:hypothetical protein